MTIRFILKRSEFCTYSGAAVERYETVDVECSELQMRLQRGGQGPQGHDITHLVGAEVLTGPVPHTNAAATGA